MKFVCYSQWNQLPESANTLFIESQQYSLFCSRTWLENLTAHALTEQQSLVLACVLKDETVLAILPLLKHAQGGLSALSNNFTSLFSLLLSKRGKNHDILECLADGLANGLASGSAQPHQPIQLEPIDPNDDDMNYLRQSMESCGFQSYPYFRFYNWIHPLEGQSFDEYMAGRPANLRNTIRRKQRKLEREHGYEIKLHKDENINQSLITQALADYHAIYKTSWKTNEFFSDFTPALVKSLFQRGWLRLAILYTNEQPIAAQIWFVVHSKASIYRLVYDENWKEYSPGSVLTQYVMRYVIDTDKVSEIDFLTGNERYKQDWMTVRRERLGIRFAKPPEQKNYLTQSIQSLKKLLSLN
ncbi:MAG: GNAT family N-acetyltransferase [Gammaproteobacteria bacterium]